MTTTTISGIATSASALTGSELFEAEQAAATVKVLASQLLTYCKDSGHLQTVGDANATISSGIRIVLITTSLTAARTYTLPAANSAAQGDLVIVIDMTGSLTATNTATVTRAGTDTINGTTGVVMMGAYAAIHCRTDGSTKWSARIESQNAGDITTGTLGAARLPNPSSSTLGGVQSLASVAHKWIDSISTSGVPSATQPDASDLTGLAASATTDTTNAANITSGLLPLGRLSNAQTVGDANATITSGKLAILLTAAITAARTYTLPAASAYPAGTEILFADVIGTLTGTNTATILRAGTDTVNGTTGAVLSAANNVIWLVSDGSTKWTTQTPSAGGSGSGSGAQVQKDSWTSSGSYTWTKQSWAKEVYMFVVGAGGGGGSGRKGAAAGNRRGGGGGGSGGTSDRTMAAADMGSTETVVVGAKGTSGAAQTTNSTSGNDGGAGGASYVGHHCYAQGGSQGIGGGTSGGGQGGAGGAGTVSNGATGGVGSNTAGSNGAGANWGSSSGAGGGGITSSNTISNGGNTVASPILTDAPSSAGTGGSGDGAAGTGGGTHASSGFGAAAGGGASSITATGGGAGGNGQGFGAGGSGGGAAVDSTGNSGAGGTGADGAVIVIQIG